MTPAQEGTPVIVTQTELKAAHARISRLEAKVDTNQAKLGDVAEKVSWIKGYLEVHGADHRPIRDVGIVAGGGGVVGALVYLLEKLFGG